MGGVVVVLAMAIIFTLQLAAWGSIEGRE